MVVISQTVEVCDRDDVALFINLSTKMGSTNIYKLQNTNIMDETKYQIW